MFEPEPKRPKVLKGEIETRKVIEMIMPVIEETKKYQSPPPKPSKEKQPPKEDKKPVSMFGMFDDDELKEVSPLK